MHQPNAGELSRRHVPKATGAIVAGRENTAPLRIELRGIYFVLVPKFEGGNTFRNFPQDRGVRGYADELRFIEGMEDQRVNILRLLDFAETLSTLGVPKPHRSIDRPRGKISALRADRDGVDRIGILELRRSTEFPRLRIAKTHGAIEADGDDAPAIRRKESAAERP